MWLQDILFGDTLILIKRLRTLSFIEKSSKYLDFLEIFTSLKPDSQMFVTAQFLFFTEHVVYQVL